MVGGSKQQTTNTEQQTTNNKTMATTLTNSSIPIGAITSLVYSVPIAKSAIVLNLSICSVVDEDVNVVIFKEKATGGFITLARKTIEFSNLDIYHPQLDKLVLLAGEKLYARAVGSSLPTRATGLFGIPTIIDPLTNSESSPAHISLSVALRD